MGFFGKKKKSESATLKQPVSRSRSNNSNISKSVRFAASPVSDDEGGFATDSELEIQRPQRQLQQGRVQPIPAARPVRTNSYNENRKYHPNDLRGTMPSPLNGTAHHYSEYGGYSSSVDDDCLSEMETSTTGSSFARGSRIRSSLPILRPAYLSQSGGLVFLTYNNETKKNTLKGDVQSMETVKAMFLQAFPQLTLDMLDMTKRRFYILDRTTNKFLLLTNLRDIRDGTMLKLLDVETHQPSHAIRSRSAHSALSHDLNYFSEPEYGVKDSPSSSRSSSYRVQRPMSRSSITKETNIDEPVMSRAFHSLPHKVQISSIIPSANYQTQNANLQANITLPHQTANYGSAVGFVNNSPYGHSGAPDLPGYNQSDYTDLDAEITKANEAASSLEPVIKDDRSRMAKMEAQIANLTAWVQTTLSRPNSVTSEHFSEASYASSQRTKDVEGCAEIAKMLGISHASSSTPQPELGEAVIKNIRSVAMQAKELKSEIKQFKRIQQAQAESVRESLKDAFILIQNAIAKIPGAREYPLRSQRDSVNLALENYRTEYDEVIKQISDLEACVSEFKNDVVTRHCHVNLSEVEALALRLSKATRSATVIKCKFPKLQKDLKQVLIGEMEVVVEQERFIKAEPDCIEDVLKRCKALTTVLYTLKRLANVQDHRSAIVPHIKAKPTEEIDKQGLLTSIKSIVPNEQDRLQAIKDAENSVERRKNILAVKDTLKFEKSLELASKNLKEAEAVSCTAFDNSVSKLVAEVKDNQCTEKATSSSTPQNDKVVLRDQKNQETPVFIQNRDSIHWDMDSDDDSSDDENEQKPFVDVTDAPLSAFSVVNQVNNVSPNDNKNAHIYGNSLVSTRYNNSPEAGKLANGHAHVLTDHQKMEDTNRSKLQEQYKKLQQLQKNYRHKSPVVISDFQKQKGKPVTKPAIAPKPRLARPAVNARPNSIATGSAVSTKAEASESNNDNNNSNVVSGSHVNHTATLSSNDYKSTTV